jgi:hypothetical protein
LSCHIIGKHQEEVSENKIFPNNIIREYGLKGRMKRGKAINQFSVTVRNSSDILLEMPHYWNG